MAVQVGHQNHLGYNFTAVRIEPSLQWYALGYSAPPGSEWKNQKMRYKTILENYKNENITCVNQKNKQSGIVLDKHFSNLLQTIGQKKRQRFIKIAAATVSSVLLFALFFYHSSCKY